jgi:hypothetical protein
MNVKVNIKGKMYILMNVESIVDLIREIITNMGPVITAIHWIKTIGKVHTYEIQVENDSSINATVEEI